MATTQQRMKEQFKEFLDGACEAALWSTVPAAPNESAMLHMDYADAFQAGPEFWNQLRGVVAHSARQFFAEQHQDLVDTHLATDRHWEDLGHDFHLSAEGHGAGYWDREDPDQDRAERLTDAARQYEGYLQLYLDTDLQLHVDTGNVVSFTEELFLD